jgi:hypothetical protein
MKARAFGFSLLLLSCPSLAWAQIPKRFDIDCVWTETDATAGRSSSTLSGIRQRFRIDTVRMARCEANCSTLFSIVEATADRVVLSRSTSSVEVDVREYRSDRTFLWNTEYLGSNRRITRRGSCEVRRFSGFPRDAVDYTRN